MTDNGQNGTHYTGRNGTPATGGSFVEMLTASDTSPNEEALLTAHARLVASVIRLGDHAQDAMRGALANVSDLHTKVGLLVMQTNDYANGKGKGTTDQKLKAIFDAAEKLGVHREKAVLAEGVPAPVRAFLNSLKGEVDTVQQRYEEYEQVARVVFYRDLKTGISGKNGSHEGNGHVVGAVR